VTPLVLRTRDALRAALGESRPGFVPTMGALHAGHLSLIARSAVENELTVVSIFVNPRQFAQASDLDRYPRDLERDSADAGAAGADLIFAPAVDAIYPPGFSTTVDVGSLAKCWEGASRPGHFQGVATVVTILLGLVRPARSYFGEKDYQQLQIIRRLRDDLALPGEIVACPTIRDIDGLALSSRNQRLSAGGRALAGAIPRAIDAVRTAAAAGEHDVHLLEQRGESVLDQPGVHLDYLSIVDGMTLEPQTWLAPTSRLLIAAEIDGVRLIDNAAVLDREPPPS
jgi:pantoate--beta-alanine ligase